MSNVTSLHPLTIFLLIASMPLAASSLDLFLPALPAMVKEFGTNEETIQYSIVLNIIASACLGFSSGIISDSIGRRRLFLGALYLFASATYMCSLATNVGFFLVARTLQGAASGVIFVLVSTIVSDVYTGVKKSQVLGLSTFLFPVALGVAPFVGERIYRHYGWPATFILLAVLLFTAAFILSFMLPETRKHRGHTFTLKKVIQDASIILRTPAFLVNALIPAAFMGAYMCFVAYSAFIYMNYFNLKSDQYVYYLIAPLMFQFVAGLLYQWVVRLLGVNRTLMTAMIAASLAFIIMVAMYVGILPMDPIILMAAMLCYNMSIPFVLPTVSSKAFETYPDKGGTISSISSLLRNASMASYLFIAGKVFNNTPQPILMLLMVGIALFITLGLYSIQLSAKAQAKTA